MPDYQYTAYFEKEVLRKRPYIRREWCIRVIESPVRVERQGKDRWRFWGVVPELEETTGKWKYYSAMALAQLPDGAGVPSLIRMAQDPNEAGKGILDVVLQTLAQVSTQYPEARAALVEHFRTWNR